MLNVFDNIFSTHCVVCDTPLSGINLNHIGDKYYCFDDWQRLEEKPIDKQIQREDKSLRKLMANAD